MENHATRKWLVFAAATMLLALFGALFVSQAAVAEAESVLVKRVVGQVEDNVGMPIENALIVARRLDRTGSAETFTDIDGQYELRLTAGLWSLTVKAVPASNPTNWLYPHAPQIVHFDDDTEDEQKRVHFVVLSADSSVSGSIDLPDGSVPNFAVEINIRNNEGHGTTTQMAEDGTFSAELPHGNYIIHLKPGRDDYAGPLPTRVNLPPEGNQAVGTLTLVPVDGVITGRVVDEFGNGIPDINVIGWTRQHGSAQTTTNDDGAYTLNVTAGDWKIKPQVSAEFPYVYTGEAAQISIESEETVEEIDFELTSANTLISGQLIDENGDPAPAWGWAYARGEGTQNGGPIRAGTFSFYLPDGQYKLGANLADGSRWMAQFPVDLAVNGQDQIDVELTVLPKNATFVGTLWDRRNEVTVPNVDGHVFAVNPWAIARTDINSDNGAYRLKVSAGPWRIGYGVNPASGYVPLTHSRVVPIESGETLAVPLPVAQRDARLQGSVKDPSGQPLAGAVVTAQGMGHGLHNVRLHTLTRADGSFDLAVPYGHYRLVAAVGQDQMTVSNYSRSTTDWLNPAEKMISAEPNSTTGDLTLTFREPDITLSGTTSLTPPNSEDGTVYIWAYGANGAATRATTELGEPYQLGLLSNSKWHIAGALETDTSYYIIRHAITLGESDATLDLQLDGPFPKPGPVVLTFDSAETAQLTLADGANITIPAGAMPVSGTITLHITPAVTLPNQHHARLYQYGYIFIATDETGAVITENFLQPVTINFTYEETLLAKLGLTEDGLMPAYYSTSTESWTVPSDYVVDTEANVVTMSIDHFTDYSLLNGAPTYQVAMPIITR